MKVSEEVIDSAKGMTVTVLVDNTASFGTTYLAQHAFSLMVNIETNNKHHKIIFDVGASAMPILHNMKLMNIDLYDCDSIVLSHCHLDHTGGLFNIIENMNNQVTLYCHSTLFRHCFKEEPQYKNCGIQGDHLKMHILSHIDNIINTDEPIKIANGIYTTGEIQRSENNPTYNKTTYYTINEDAEKVIDTIADENALIINIEEKGLVIITGCCHSGVINTVEHAMQVTGINKIHSIIGGLHMLNFETQEINDVVDKLNAIGVESLYLGHCTGEEAKRIIKERFDGKCDFLAVGKSIAFTDLSVR